MGLGASGHRSLRPAPLRGRARREGGQCHGETARSAAVPGRRLPAAPYRPAGCGTESTQSRRLCLCVTGWRRANDSPGEWRFLGPGRWGPELPAFRPRESFPWRVCAPGAVARCRHLFRARTLLRAFEGALSAVTRGPQGPDWPRALRGPRAGAPGPVSRLHPGDRG